MTVNDIKQNHFCEKYDITSYSNSVLRIFVDKTDKRGFDNPDEKKSFFSFAEFRYAFVSFARTK